MHERLVLRGKYMETIIKIAEIKAADTKSLNKITNVLENVGFIIAYDKEYEEYAYVCIRD